MSSGLVTFGIHGAGSVLAFKPSQLSSARSGGLAGRADGRADGRAEGRGGSQRRCLGQRCCARRRKSAQGGNPPLNHSWCLMSSAPRRMQPRRDTVSRVSRPEIRLLALRSDTLAGNLRLACIMLRQMEIWSPPPFGSQKGEWPTSIS